MTEKSITEVTRRNIVDAFALEKIEWSGRLEEQEFLARLYNVAEMPSNDHRFSNAFGDIRQHRVYNTDWSDDWMFYDDRFNLFHAPDEEFLRFLCEVLHPAVQPDEDEVERIHSIVNDRLRKDGWVLKEQMRLSERPIFAAYRSIGAQVHSAESARLVTEAIGVEYVNRQVIRMQTALHSEPDVAIGTAKDFVETICKTILAERNVSYDPHEKMPKLVKQTAASLELVPRSISDQAKAADSVRRILSNLTSVSNGLAELRNLFGTGHGKEANVVGLAGRHARLVVDSATALAVFLWESHMETKNQ